MLALWNGGLWLLRLVLGFMDTFAHPGPARERTDGRGLPDHVLGRRHPGHRSWRWSSPGSPRSAATGVPWPGSLVGTGQFVMVWVAWTPTPLLLLYACCGLTTAIMRATMGVDAWSQWQPWGHSGREDITDGTIATVLGILGMLVVVAAIGHLLVMLTRAAALVILTATAPIAAAGLVSEVGASWFWKCAALDPRRRVHPTADGAGHRGRDQGHLRHRHRDRDVPVRGGGHRRARGGADPDQLLRPAGAVPDARVRRPRHQLRGRDALRVRRRRRRPRRSWPAPAAATGTAASSTDSTGRAAGEGASEEATSARFTQSAGGFLGTVGGSLGGAASRALGAAGSLAAPGPRSGRTCPTRWGSGTPATSPTSPPAAPRTARHQGPPEVRGDNPDPGGDSLAQPHAVGAALPGPGCRVHRTRRGRRWRHRQWRHRCGSRRPDRPRLGRQDPLMNHVYYDYSRARIGFFFGLTGWQLTAVGLGVLAGAVGHQPRRLGRRRSVPGDLAGPRRRGGDPDPGPLGNRLAGRRHRPRRRNPDRVDPVPLPRLTGRHRGPGRGGPARCPGRDRGPRGPTAGPDQRRVALIQNHTTRTWAVTARWSTPGSG